MEAKTTFTQPPAAMQWGKADFIHIRGKITRCRAHALESGQHIENSKRHITTVTIEGEDGKSITLLDLHTQGEVAEENPLRTGNFVEIIAAPGYPDEPTTIGLNWKRKTHVYAVCANGRKWLGGDLKETNFRHKPMSIWATIIMVLFALLVSPLLILFSWVPMVLFGSLGLLQQIFRHRTIYRMLASYNDMKDYLEPRWGKTDAEARAQLGLPVVPELAEPIEPPLAKAA